MNTPHTGSLHLGLAWRVWEQRQPCMSGATGRPAGKTAGCFFGCHAFGGIAWGCGKQRPCTSRMPHRTSADPFLFAPALQLVFPCLQPFVRGSENRQRQRQLCPAGRRRPVLQCIPPHLLPDSEVGPATERACSRPLLPLRLLLLLRPLLLRSPFLLLWRAWDTV